MLGTPPASTAALPSFLVEDSDFLPSWSKAMSTSPRLEPCLVPGAAPAAADKSPTLTAVGMDVFGLDSHLTGQGASRNAAVHDPSKPKSPLDVGTDLSPVFGPTLMSASAASFEGGQDHDMGDVAEAFGMQHRSSFESSFSNYHQAAPTEAATPQKSPKRRKLSSGDLAAPLSFANVATLPSLSPIVPTVTIEAESSLRELSNSGLDGSAAPSPVRALPKPESHSAANFAQWLPVGLQRRTTLGGAADDREGGKIQAYAKLEFPSFDIYIQKLSVTIGRRPAGASLRSSAAAPSFDEARATGLSLEDYILGLTDAFLVKREETLPTIDPNTPANPLPSIKGKEKAYDGDTFSEFVRSSPPPSNSVPAHAPVPGTAHPSLPSQLSPSIAPLMPAAPAVTLTDVDLGPLRAVSRQHARLSFDYEVGAWVLEVLGRNGVVIEGKWRAKGQKAILNKKTKIQIAERIFHFVLPTSTVVAAKSENAAESGTKSSKAKGKDKSRLRAPGRGKGKGKAKRRASGDHDSSSSLSEVSDSEVELSPLMKASPELPTSPQKDAPNPTVSSAPHIPHSPAAAASALSSAPSLPDTAPSASRPPLAGKGKATSFPPPPALPAAPTSVAPVTAAKSRTPLPAKTPATRSAHKPKSLSDTAPSAVQPLLPLRGTGSAVDDDELEEARARAAMIAQILSGRGVAGMSNAALVRAAAEAQRRQSGKGKAPMRSAGKGPGKGKGLPPRARRPSNASWDDDDDDSMSSDSGDSDHELLIEAFQEAANLGHDIRGGGQGGGKHFIARPAPDPTSPAAPLPVPPAGAATPSSTSTPKPKGAGKMPAKQPRARRNPSISDSAVAGSNGTVPAASGSPAPTPSTLSANLPPLPLSALPNFTPSPAPPTPAMLAASALPPLPELKHSAASPATTTPALPPLPQITSATAVSPAPAPVILPSAAEANPPAAAAAPAAPASNTALPLAPPPVVPTPPTVSVTPAPAAPPKKRSHKKKVPPKEGAAGDGVAGTANPQGAGTDGTAPVKPRPSPYAPAPLPPGATPPDEAPADNRQAKPPYTYASLIAQAITQSESKKITLHDVYDWIVQRWPYFKDNQAGWQNSIRHNLTPARGFLKVVRKADEPGKGSFWEMDPAQMPNFDGHHFRIKKTEGAAAAAAAGASAAKAAQSGAGPPASPAPAAAPSPAIAAAVEVSTTAAAKSKGAAASSTSSTVKPKTVAPAAPAAPASRPASASPAPQAAATANSQLSKPLPIVVSPLPASFVPPTPPPESASGAPTDELTASLLANPPIVLHEGKLILRPEIFATSLSEARLAELQKMPASAVLPILQAQVVQHFKDKLRTKGSLTNSPAPSKPAKATAKAPKSSSKAPRAGAPVAQKKPKSAATNASSAANSAAPPAASTTAAGAKRARDSETDQTGSTASPSSAKPAKVAKKATAATAGATLTAPSPGR